MAKVSTFHHAFNLGVADKDKLVRIDQERMRLTAEQQTNLPCTTTGKMFLRPGQDYLTNTLDNGQVRLKDFIASSSAAALIEYADQALRVLVDDVPVKRLAVTSTVQSGDFSASTGWTLAPTTGANASISGGLLTLDAPAKGSRAIARQQVTTSSPGVEHALRIDVERGPVVFRCGSASGEDDYIAETTLKTGTHSLAFTPAGSYWVQFASDAPRDRRVSSIEVEAAGDLVIPTPWVADDLSLLRISQSADVAFIAAKGYRPYRLERRGDHSWSLVHYTSDNGPFFANRTAAVRLKPNVTQGNGSLFADAEFFKPEHVGALFRLYHTGQRVYQSLAGEERFTDPFELTGVSGARSWSYTVGGTWTGTLRLYRSSDSADDGFQPYQYETGGSGTQIPANGSYLNKDEDDNAIVWYRIGFGAGEYVSGAADVSIIYDGGGGFGICRVTAYTSPTQVSIEVLRPFRAVKYTDDWLESEWSDLRGYPSACAFFEGRLYTGGRDRIWGSVADDYENFDDEIEGDAAPISRSIATGGVCQSQWILPLARLVFGTDAGEATARSSSFDEPLTDTNLTLKNSSTIGSSPVDPLRVDGRGLFVDRTGQALFEMILSADAGDYSSTELSRLNTDLFTSGIREIAVQRRPDTRLWIVTNNGGLVCVLYEPSQEAFAFIPYETMGSYESVAVLPSLVQDRLYISVKRTVGGDEVHFIERTALDSEAAPLAFAKVMDAAVQVTNVSPSAVMSGLDHLEGEQVKVWADGAPLTIMSDGKRIPHLLTVAGGQITLPAPATRVVAGLPYKGRFKTARLAYGAERGTPMLQRKRVDELGIIMTDFVRDGVRYGGKFDDVNHPLDPLPQMKDGIAAPAIVISDVQDEVPFVFDGDWTTDSRVCLEVEWPAAFLGIVMTVTTNEK